MIETINEDSLFCDYYSQWVRVYKEGAIRDVTMVKYRLTQSWLERLIPDLKVCDLDRTAYQQLINGYAEHRERQTTMGFHHQLQANRLAQECCTEQKRPVCSTEFIVYKPDEPEHKSFYYATIGAPAFTAFSLAHVRALQAVVRGPNRKPHSCTRCPLQELRQLKISVLLQIPFMNR